MPPVLLFATYAQAMINPPTAALSALFETSTLVEDPVTLVMLADPPAICELEMTSCVGDAELASTPAEDVPTAATRTPSNVDTPEVRASNTPTELVPATAAARIATSRTVDVPVPSRSTPYAVSVLPSMFVAVADVVPPTHVGDEAPET